MSEVAVKTHQELITENNQKITFGFWVYLMTDCLLFAALFATFAVLRNNTYGGPNGAQLFDLNYVLTETLVLLTSSFTCGIAMLAARAGYVKRAMTWFSVTFVLGLTFLVMELTEFHKFAHMGDSWRRSGFLSSFFTLVGTHGAHISIGLLWILVMIIKVGSTGLSKANLRRLTMLSLFWHFLDIIWIFIFTIVFLLGVTL